MSLINSTAAIQPILGAPPAGPEVAPVKSTVNFNQMLQDCKSKLCWQSLTGEGLHRDLINFKQQILQGRTFSARELLVYQIRAAELNLRVELFGKMADALVATTRRLQSGQ